VLIVTHFSQTWTGQDPGYRRNDGTSWNGAWSSDHHIQSRAAWELSSDLLHTLCAALRNGDCCPPVLGQTSATRVGKVGVREALKALAIKRMMHAKLNSNGQFGQLATDHNAVVLTGPRSTWQRITCCQQLRAHLTSTVPLRERLNLRLRRARAQRRAVEPRSSPPPLLRHL
jgi:hypothetical protein